MMIPQHQDYLLSKGDTLSLDTIQLAASNADYVWTGATGRGQIRIVPDGALIAPLTIILEDDGPRLTINGVLDASDSLELIPGCTYFGDVEVTSGNLVLTPHTFSVFVRQDITHN